MTRLARAAAAIGHAANVLFGTPSNRHGSPAAFPDRGEVAVSDGPMVIAYHPSARQAGEGVLAAGGNACDAFVAAVVAENVVAEGASSLAGSLSALVHVAAEGRTLYLDGGFNDPVDRAAAWSPGRGTGRAVLVPGAPAALAALHGRFGRLPWARLLEPGIALAEEGFAPTRLMSAVAALRTRELRRSDYGRATYRPDDGLPPRMHLPHVAAFLRRLAEDGPDHVYRGAWGKAFLRTVAAAGGRLTARDLSVYEARWDEPHVGDFRGCRVESSSGRSYGGLWVQLALATLDRSGIDDAGSIAQRMAIARGTWREPRLFDPAVLDDRSASRWRAADGAPAVIEGLVDGEGRAAAAAHSYPIIVRDGDGTIVNGTTTAQSEPWGDGLFVQGVSLTASGRIAFGVAPGERRLSPFSQHLVHGDDGPRLVVGTISNSAVEAAFQLLATLVGTDADLGAAVALPRFGTFPPKRRSLRPKPDLSRMWLDPRVGREERDAIAARRLRVSQRDPVDTGLGAVMRIGPGRIEGATLPLPYLDDPFAEEAS